MAPRKRPAPAAKKATGGKRGRPATERQAADNTVRRTRPRAGALPSNEPPVDQLQPQPIDVNSIVVVEPPQRTRASTINSRTSTDINTEAEVISEQGDNSDRQNELRGMRVTGQRDVNRDILQGNEASVNASANVRSNVNVDPTFSIGQAIMETLRAVRDVAASENGSRLGGRPSFLKELPEFNGDPLEFPLFEKRFQDSTKDFEYTDSDNIVRLQKAVRGDAKLRNKTLLATASSARSVMNSLKLQFGNPAVIAERISEDIENLPSMKRGEVNIVEFATGLNNALTAFKSLTLTGYLTEASLWKTVIGKLPSNLQMTFSDYLVTTTGNETKIEKLSNFLLQKAENAVSAGIVNLAATSSSKTKSAKDNDSSRRSGQSSRHAVVCATGARTDDRTPNTRNERERSKRCGLCGTDEHTLRECQAFKEKSLDDKWNVAGKLRVCFNCLGPDHSRMRCRSQQTCNVCNTHHHTLLHFERRKGEKSKDCEINSRDSEKRSDDRPRQDERNQRESVTEKSA